MSILVVGSVALDTVRTPFGRAAEVLGGSATHFAAAASFFAEVRVVAVVGEDFPDHQLEFLRARQVDLRGLQRRPGRTFRWVGEYDFDLNAAPAWAGFGDIDLRGHPEQRLGGLGWNGRRAFPAGGSPSEPPVRRAAAVMHLCIAIRGDARGGTRTLMS